MNGYPFSQITKSNKAVNVLLDNVKETKKKIDRRKKAKIKTVYLTDLSDRKKNSDKQTNKEIKEQEKNDKKSLRISITAYKS